jgi:hypothetical protein
MPKRKDLLPDMIMEEDLSKSRKDEFIVIILLSPIPLTFISTFVSGETMSDAWNNIGLMPEWYQNLLTVILLVVFGLKALLFKIADKLFCTK